ncbi:hypothetical protein G6F56_005687 [Rhizopus delemar]|uniref:PSP1 C-terminal domain-containing protein n=1 Tax=Rhizopus stolonifer TaxID=4846 RepID=A0A367KR15_RHIST|nr:hypothetical protein G6F56_005687 [Rhizopus delemar]RCI04587.1 hypothetical protein CU098_013140 [Rhizopus stolonifer]
MTNETNKEVPFINSVFSGQYISLLPSPPIQIVPTRSQSISWHPLWNQGDSIWKVEGARPRSNSLVSANSALDDYFQPRKRGSLVPTDIWPLEEEEMIRRPPTPPFQEAVVVNPTMVPGSIHNLGKGLPLQEIKTSDIYQVEFKNRLNYFYAENLVIQKDDYVIVEGDRGYDLGKVTAILEKKNVQEKQIRRLFCKANQEELSNYTIKQEEEKKALAICQWKIKQRGLEMEVVDAEYQWDRRKLTFYFRATQRIDFRDLVRELFKIYKTRIWMSCA